MYLGYNINSTKEDGKVESVNGKYPNEYLQMLYNIVREKFPVLQDLIDERGKLQFMLSSDEENEMFYRYLAVFVSGFNRISYLAEKSPFMSEVKDMEWFMTIIILLWIL